MGKTRKKIVQFPVPGLERATLADVEDRRESSRRSLEMLKETNKRAHARHREELERRRLRPGSVVGVNPATYLWASVIEEFAEEYGIDGCRKIVCKRCNDRDVCDWGESWGCDRQLNVGRFFDGKKTPLYRPEEEEG